MRFNKLFCGCLAQPRTCEGELAALSQELGQAEGFGAFKARVSGEAQNDAAERKISSNSSSSVRCTRQRVSSNPDYLYNRDARGRSTSSRALVGGVEYNSFFVNPLAEGSHDEGLPIAYAGASIAQAPSSLNNPLAEEFTTIAASPPGSPSRVRKSLALATPCDWDGDADYSAPTTPGTPSRPVHTFTAVDNLLQPATPQPPEAAEQAAALGPRAAELSPAQTSAQLGRVALCSGAPSCPNLQSEGSAGGAPPPHLGAACCGGRVAAVRSGPYGQETPPPSTPSLRLTELRAALAEPSAACHSARLASPGELSTVQEEQQQEVQEQEKQQWQHKQQQEEEEEVILATSVSADVDSRTQSPPALDAPLTEPFAPSTPPLAAREVGGAPASPAAGPPGAAAEEKAGVAACGSGLGLVTVEEHDPVRRQLAEVLCQTRSVSDAAHETVGVEGGQEEEAAEVQRLDPVAPSVGCTTGALLEGLMTATSTLRLPLPPPRGRRDAAGKLLQPEPERAAGDAAVLIVAAPEAVTPTCGPDVTTLVKDFAAEADEVDEAHAETAFVHSGGRAAERASVAYGGSLGGAVGHLKTSSYGGAIQRVRGPLSTPGAPASDATNEPGCSISGLAMTRALIRQLGLLPAPGLEVRDSHAAVAVAAAVVVVGASPAEPPKVAVAPPPLALLDCAQVDGVASLSPSPFAAACRTAKAALDGDRDGDTAVVVLAAKAAGCTTGVDEPQLGNSLAGVPRCTEVLDSGCDGEAVICAVSQNTAVTAAGCVPAREWRAPDGRDGGKVEAGEVKEAAAAAAALSDERVEGAVEGEQVEGGGEEGSEGGGDGSGDEDDERYSLVSSSSASSLGDEDAEEGTGRAMVVVSSRSLQAWLEPQGWTPLRERFGRVGAVV